MHSIRKSSNKFWLLRIILKGNSQYVSLYRIKKQDLKVEDNIIYQIMNIIDGSCSEYIVSIKVEKV